MTQNLDARLSQHSSPVLGIFRILIGFMFALHGSAKVLGWPATSVGKIPVGNWPYWYAGLIELIIGVLLILGVFSRLAALVGLGEMAFAYFTEHQPKGLLPIENGGELAVLYALAFLVIAFAGAGAFALQKHRAG
ncbi:MAG: DoxX family protein [Mycobacterium sp.]|nr:DoxX family protein [Mycobacterium sp.]